MSDKKASGFLLLLFFVSATCWSVEGEQAVPLQDEYLKRAVEFHGHLGPYLVLGLKAGLQANEVLGKDPMNMKALVKTRKSPPQSCFIDGVQFSAGCTLGKGTISLEEGEGLSVAFEKNGKVLSLTLRSEIIAEISSLPSQEDAWERLALDLYSRKTEEMFELSPEKKRLPSI